MARADSIEDEADLPVFAYHPRPLETGSIVAQEVECVCCGQNRAYTYVGPVFAVEELDRELCPWCIADGSAADRFDAQYTDVLWSVPGDVSEEVTEVILRRTPGFLGWQQERWLHHCGDAAMFLGAAGFAELSGFSDAMEMLRNERLGFGWLAEDVERYLSLLDKSGQPTAYLFGCRVCDRKLAYSDFT